LSEAQPDFFERAGEMGVPVVPPNERERTFALLCPMNRRNSIIFVASSLAEWRREERIARNGHNEKKKREIRTKSLRNLFV